MYLLNTTAIRTTRGLELYLDLVKNISIKELCIPTVNNPFYEVKFEVNYFLLEQNKYYDQQKNYFWLVMNKNLNLITLRETEMKSLFAIKNEVERKATKQLLGDWFISTNAYKKAIFQYIEVDIQKNIQVENNECTKKALKFLEKLLELETTDIKKALVEKPVYS
ncbi:hypothetical protein [Priestia megaterium]|uniref:hypothetical protein n=1 Tax=Priestia megaterium TaxID=1404 RepID=UPI0027838E7B|nr:hypothetical protein [Bacillus sp. 1751]